MHARHRNPGNGYRPSSVGMGMFPESSARGHGFYNSEFRSFNRGIGGIGRGQGHPKSFQQPQPTPKKGDIFMEAGRLAAEYLVSHGLLPPAVLSGKWQNGTFRSIDGENPHIPPESRSSALTRLGSSVSDMGSGRRRYPDDNSSMGLSSYLKGRKKGGSFRSYGSDWGREYGRSGSWSGRGRTSPEMQGDDDSYSAHQEGQQVGKDVSEGMQKDGSGEAGVIESEPEKHSFQEEMGSRASSSSISKDLPNETDGESSKRAEDAANMYSGAGEQKGGISQDETEKKDMTEGSSVEHHTAENDGLGKSNTDLLTFCKFAKIPTKTRSSLTYKGVKVDSVSNNEEEHASDTKLSKVSDVFVADDSLGSSTVDAVPNKTCDSKCNYSELPAQSGELVGALASAGEQGESESSQSVQGALVHATEQERDQGLTGLQMSSSVVKERGEKRTMEDIDAEDGTKRLKEWFPTIVSKADNFFNMSNMSETKTSSQFEVNPSREKVTLSTSQECAISDYQFPEGKGEPCAQYAQEKQLFPGSFKICDLNLMGSSDINESHHADSTLIYPAVPEKGSTSVDIDLSMSNSNMTGEYSRCTTGAKEIEVIDLENDSTHENRASENSERKTETMFTGLEGFPNHAQNTGHIPDVQDNYDGLMFTQLLDPFTDCPPPVDMNNLQNNMGLHNEEGAIGDDDSIYMSLGEIPLKISLEVMKLLKKELPNSGSCFLRGWEQQPPQEYGKPF